MLSFEDRMKLLEELPDDSGRGIIAKALLEEKYGKEFEVFQVRPLEIFQDDFQVIMYPYDFPELLFIAKVSLDGKTVTDNYAVKLACNDYCDTMLARIPQMNGDLFIRLNSLNAGFGLVEKSISLAEYQKMNPGNKYVLLFFYSEDEEKTDNLYSIVNQMISGDEKISGRLMYYKVSENQLADIQLYLESHDRIYMDFQDVLDNVIPTEVKFESGRISISESEWKERIG